RPRPIPTPAARNHPPAGSHFAQAAVAHAAARRPAPRRRSAMAPALTSRLDSRSSTTARTFGGGGIVAGGPPATLGGLGRHRRRVAGDARLQLVPLAVLPELGPLLDGHRQLERGLVLLDLARVLGVGEAEVARPEAADALAVDAHEVAADVVVDHRLVRLAVL